jgi:hypothetical protein
MQGHRPSVRTRATITLFLLAVLALRSLLPHGYMVQAADAAAVGAFEIVICTSAGQKLLTVGEDGTGSPQKPQHVEDGLCPFASAGAAALAAAEPQSLAGEAEYAAVTYTLAVALFAETPKPGATSARGPPRPLISVSLT